MKLQDRIQSLMHGMSISQRTLASVCLFSLPLGVLFYFNLDQLSGNISFAAKELDGNRYQRPLVQLLAAIGEYQNAGLRPSGDPAGNTGGLAVTEAKVDGLFQQLRKVESEIGAELGFSPETLREDGLERLRSDQVQAGWQAWKSLRSKEGMQEWLAQGDAIVSDLRVMIGRAGDQSNLTLDPEMDSYYLADVTSVVSAQSVARLRSASAFLLPRLKQQTQMSPSDRTQAAIYAAAIRESDMDRILGDLDTATRENNRAKRGPSSTLRAKIQAVQGTYEKSMKQLLETLTRAVDGKMVRQEELEKSFTQASQSALDLHGVAVGELDLILRARIADFAAYRMKLISGTLAALLLAGLLFVLVVHSITGPLAVAVHYLERVSTGELAQDLPAKYLSRGDEIGQLSRSMQAMLVKLRQIVGDINNGIQLLAVAEAGVSSASRQMTEGSSDASQRVHTVAAAAEEMSANVAFVAAGMGEASSNLGRIAGATEQMTATISEIARNSEMARRITGEASQQARHVTQTIHQLGAAATEIGKVTEVITEISSQTNLLALNATIEAARAGAAGKGFAVVANEIKALAQQTATATEDIRARISSVQSSTAQGIAGVEKVTGVISDVSQIVSSIAAAIEEQSASTRDIASNITRASLGVQDASARVAESSQATGEIARDIVVVNRAAGEMASSGERLRESSARLSSVSSQLEAAAGQFQL